MRGGRKKRKSWFPTFPSLALPGGGSRTDLVVLITGVRVSPTVSRSLLNTEPYVQYVYIQTCTYVYALNVRFLVAALSQNCSDKISERARDFPEQRG